jgi:hypothetical protein
MLRTQASFQWSISLAWDRDDRTVESRHISVITATL